MAKRLNKNLLVGTLGLTWSIIPELLGFTNMQIIGYKTNFMSQTDSLHEYPLHEYLKRGLKVCVNTDNPGINFLSPYPNPSQP